MTAERTFGSPRRRAAALATALALGTALAGCRGCSGRSEPKAGADAGAGSTRAATPAKSSFARFAPKPVATAVKPVKTPTIGADLKNVSVSMLLTPAQRAKVAEVGFTVSPGSTKEFYELYERARYDYLPIFVTSDSLLHVYHLLFDKALRTTEAGPLSAALVALDLALLDTSKKQLAELAGTPLAEAAKRNAAYFALAVKLLQPDFGVPPELAPLVNADLAAMDKHAGPGPSAIFPGYPEGEDWSQYVPRGHYTKTDALKAYFRAMMWHGRMTFRASDAEETKRAALLLIALERTQVNGKPAEAAWASIYEPTVFFVGRSDDLTPAEYDGAFRAAYGQVTQLGAIDDAAKLARFQQAIGELRAPEVLGMVVSRKEANVEKATQGLRFMGQRTVPDSVVFRALIDRNVPGRMLPRALDFFAALGSQRATEHLTALGDTKIPGYSEALEKVRRDFASYDDATFTQNLYWTWIHTLRPLLGAVPDGYPQFMRSPAWLDKQLVTALASWTELKHDTLLYAKPVYAEMGGGGLPPPEPEPPKGYVEPVPALYARLEALAAMTKEGLAARGLLAERDSASLDKMVGLAGQLRAIAEKELAGAPVTPDEYELIRFYGGKIEELTFAATDELEPGGTPEGGDALQAAIVADIATDPNGAVLEVAVGRVFELYAAVPIEGRLVLAKGGAYSHYEFTQPIAERLTDEAWQKRVEEGNLPPLAPWAKSFFTTETVSQEVAQHIMSFTEAWVNAIWWGGPEGLASYLQGDALAAATAEIDGLKKAGRFVGKKRLLVEMSSFDFQDERHATVTTRETWQDDLNKGDPAEEQLEKLGERGPYTIAVTYTLEKKEAPKEVESGEAVGAPGWRITKIVPSPEPPAWKLAK